MLLPIVGVPWVGPRATAGRSVVRRLVVVWTTLACLLVAGVCLAAAPPAPAVRFSVGEDGPELGAAGLPALSADGRFLMVAALEAGDGRVTASLVVRQLQARDGQVVRSWTVLGPSEELARAQLHRVLAPRVAAVNRVLAAGRWLPFEAVGLNRGSRTLAERYPENLDGFGPYRAELEGGELRLLAGGKRVASRRLSDPAGATHDEGRQVVALYRQPERGLVLVKLVDGRDCWSARVSHAVLRLRSPLAGS